MMGHIENDPQGLIDSSPKYSAFFWSIRNVRTLSPSMSPRTISTVTVYAVRRNTLTAMMQLLSQIDEVAYVLPTSKRLILLLIFLSFRFELAAVPLPR